MSLPRRRRTVAVMPRFSSCRWNCATWVLGCRLLSSTKTWVTNMSVRTTNDGFALITIEVGVSDSTQLATVRRRLEQVSGVLRVTRPAGK